MSMHEVSYSGYGCDLQNLSLDSKMLEDQWKDICDLLMDSDLTCDFANDCEINIITPCNTDDFGLLLLIPDRPAVALNKDDDTIDHLLTKNEADQLVVKTALSLLDLFQPQLKLTTVTYQDLRNALANAIVKENEYHYSDEYNDFI